MIGDQEEVDLDVELLNRVFEGIDAYRIWHCCHGGTPAPLGMVAGGIRRALQHVEPERIHLTSDCRLFAYARPAAKAKKAMVKGAEPARAELEAARG